MSFQHFRLGEIALHHPLPPHLGGPSTTTFSARPHDDHPVPTAPSIGKSKQPYGSGDSEDGYTLVFPTLDAFQQWRAQEEERNSVEFVKGDTHGSKAVPPRFKDHTKLVCARHSRSGRKKYVKKHPDRIRKVPSRKLEGIGCPASISYKTYFDKEEVRACYISQHSHDIGPANLPYTRRGRKAAALLEKEKSRALAEAATSTAVASQEPTPAPVVSSPSSSPTGPTSTPQQSSMFTSALSIPLPGPPSFQAPPPSLIQPYAYQSTPQHYTAPQPPPIQQTVSHDRWENMAAIFHSIREHARAYEYPASSIAALETILIRLYLESPMNLGMGVPQPAMVHPNSSMQNGMQAAPPPRAGRSVPHAGGGDDDDGSDDSVDE